MSAAKIEIVRATARDCCISKSDSSVESTAIVLVGAGGLGREVLHYVLEVIRPSPHMRVKGFLDDNPSESRPDGCDLPILGSILDYPIEPQDRFVMAIGDFVKRAELTRKMEARGARFMTVIHPTAYVAPNATVGNGCIVGPFCAIGSGARVGDHVLLTWYSSLAHDSVCHPFAVLSPYSTANGGAVLEEGVFLGTHAVIHPMIRVGAWSKVASGSVVYRDVPPNCLALGNPAKANPMLGASR
jgi:sugar O-acyltransferase (sialic acid O-acetyltransferase NeuD family)